MFPLPSNPLFGNFTNTGAKPRQSSATVPGISPKYNCISCTEGYHDKSLEELRWQDYQSDRKGPQPHSSFMVSPSQTLPKPRFFEPKTNNVPFGPSPITLGQHSLGAAQNTFSNQPRAFGATSTTNTPITRNNLFSANTNSMPTKQPLFSATQLNICGPNDISKFVNKPFCNLLAKPKQEISTKIQPTSQLGLQPPQKTVEPIQSPRIDTTGVNILHRPNSTNVNTQQPKQQGFAQLNDPLKLDLTPRVNPGININSTPSRSNASYSKPTYSNNLVKNNLLPCTENNFPSQTSQQLPAVGLQTSVDAQFQRCHPLLLTDPFGCQPHFKGLTPMRQSIITNKANVEKMQNYLQTPERISVSKTTRRIKTTQVADKESCREEEETSVRNFVLVRRDEEDDSKFKFSQQQEIRQSCASDAINEPPLEVKFISSCNSFSSQSDNNSIKTESTRSNSSIQSNSNVVTLDDKISDIISDAKTDTCGIILRRSGYYTIPPLDKIAEYKQSNGECLVQGFTVGRIGYGSVSFPDIMNVANLNLDELVHFRYREIVVYADESKKPALGKGLNRPAQITLDNIYPKGKGDGKLITDVETLICINFAEKLINICEKQGTRFLDYRPETGSWVFMVKHFSNYKYYDCKEINNNEPPKENDRRRCGFCKYINKE